MTDVARRVARELGTGVAAVSPLSGGDIGTSYRVRLADGRHVFAKLHAAGGTLLPLEASALSWLSAAKALPVPEVLAVSPDLLLLAYVEPGSPRPGSAEELGRGLAHLHRSGAPAYGFVDSELGPVGNLATIPLPNGATDTWAQFYGLQRILPLVAACRHAGVLDERDQRAAERLVDRLPQLVGPEEPPSRLHGDLWSGNVLWDGVGSPWLVDPSAYGGHREVDLAMLALFGMPGPGLIAAYEEVWPLPDGWRDRVGLYQLLPLLVHARLFGGGYVARATTLLHRWS